jgi:hypothetical protein
MRTIELSLLRRGAVDSLKSSASSGEFGTGIRYPVGEPRKY